MSCEDQLDLQPLGQLDENTFYQNESDFEAASLSPYSTLLNYYYDQNGTGWMRGVLYPSDDVIPQNNVNNREEDFNWNSDNGDFEYIWEQSYKGIGRANVILERLPTAAGFEDEANKARFAAEARFLRAYFHFQLAKHFGTPPVVTQQFRNVEDTQLGNSQPGEIWDAIIADLDSARADLPPSYEEENTGRVTSGAANALLGRVYLYRAQWENNATYYAQAIARLNDVVNSGLYSLVPNFGDNFGIATENNMESIFEIQMTRGNFNPWLAVDNASGNGAAGTGRLIFTRAGCGPNEDCAPGGNSLGYGRMHITQGLQGAFEENDPRRAETIYLEGDPFADTTFRAVWSVSGSTPAKYVRQEDLLGRRPQPNWSGNNERIIRYADVLLMLAEAELLGNGNTGRAVELINQVRRRADPSGDILPDRTVAGDVMMFLMQERRVEMALEGHRYNDLVRWHRAGLINIALDIDFGRAPANNNWQPRHLLKPIPQREIDLVPELRQNEGYE
ncbi:MAG: RagB/SusD family nutrient uptake outer membrane protein [Catalinimonas sp.]